jgi:putative endonuclease
LYEHENEVADGFTKKYNVHDLVFFEETESIESAIEREKQIKGWRREKKDRLVKKQNPTLKRLNETIY